MEEYIKWYINEYDKICKREEVVKFVDKKWFTEAMNKFHFMQGIWRHESMDILRNEVIIPKNKYICTVFKLMRNDFQISYGYLYSKFGKKIKHEYVCCGATYKSCDGEYRKSFIKYVQIEWTKQKFPEVFSIIESHFLNLVKSETIFIKSFSYFPESITEKQKIKFENNLNESRISIYLYILTWFTEYWKVYNKVSANHLIKGFVNTMFDDNDREVYEKVVGKLGNHANVILSNMMTFYKDPKVLSSPTVIGQKIIPINVGDLENYGDINFKPWRELFITSLVGDLVINAISPSFPILSNYFFIPSSNPELYDNGANKLKAKHSKIAQAIVKRLENVRGDTYTKNGLYISVEMEDLSEAIEIPMEYAEKEIILADKTLCVLIENIGFTMADIPPLMNIPSWREISGNVFEDFELFSKYIFEFIYALYCMNSKLGIIHGDLHLNNFTIFSTYARNINLIIRKAKKRFITYKIGDKVYIFPHYGKYGGIIDFSRSFLSSEIIRKEYVGVEAERQIDNQRRRMMKTYAHEMPEFYEEYGPEMEILMLRHFDIGFKILTALDTHRLGRGITSLIKNNPHLNANPKCLELLNSIQETARYYLRDVVRKVVSGEITKVDYCNKTIIDKLFKSFLIDNFKGPYDQIVIQDLYNYDNEMKYNIREYEKFPETVKWDIALKFKIPLDIARYERYKVLMKDIEGEDEEMEKFIKEYRAKKWERRGNPNADINAKVKNKNDCKIDVDKSDIISSGIL